MSGKGPQNGTIKELGPENDLYFSDESKSKGHADGIFLPKNESEVASIVKWVDGQHSHMTISGLRTGMCGGSVPNGGVVVSLEKMNSIIGIGVFDGRYFFRVEPCVTPKQLNEVLLTKHIGGIADITEGAAKAFLNGGDYFYPVDPTETESSFAGNASTNASGPRTFKYGSARKWICGLRVVLHDGSAIFIPRGKYLAKGRHFDVDVDGIRLTMDVPTYDFNTDVKNSAGVYAKDDMDLIDLFIGSEGIFGVITQVDVLLTERKKLVSNIMFFNDDDSAIGFIHDLKKRISPEFLEYFDCGSIDLIRRTYAGDPNMLHPPDDAGSAVFFDLPNDGNIRSAYSVVSDTAEIHGGSLGRSWGSSDRNDVNMMFKFRHAVPQAIFDYVANIKTKVPGIHKVGTDMSVPDDKIDEMMDFYKRTLAENGLEYVIFGHMGDNHPHVEIIIKSMDDFEKARSVNVLFAKKAIELGGSPSAEHGIGKIKTGYIGMMYGEKGVREIMALKMRMDPHLIFNRGDMVVIE